MDLPPDILYYEIIDRLNPVDIYNLSIISKSHRKTIHSLHWQHFSLININKMLLSTFGGQIIQFKNILRKTNAVISGSAILSCILPDKICYTDIDIYISLQGNVSGLVREDGDVYEITHMDEFISSNLGFEGIIDREYCDYGYKDYMSDKIKWIRHYGNNIKVIALNVENDIGRINHFIDIEFDTNICKSSYYITDQEYLLMKYPADIFSKQTQLKIGKDVDAGIKRYFKYTQYGFEFVNIKPEIYYDLIVNNKTLNRIGTVNIFRIKRKAYNNKVVVIESDVYRLKNFVPPYPSEYTFINSSIDNFCADTGVFDLSDTKLKEHSCGRYCPINFCDPTILHYHILYRKVFVNQYGQSSVCTPHIIFTVI